MCLQVSDGKRATSSLQIHWLAVAFWPRLERISAEAEAGNLAVGGEAQRQRRGIWRVCKA
jgi:hypothetical protein